MLRGIDTLDSALKNSSPERSSLTSLSLVKR